MKTLLVASEVQKILLEEFFIPEFNDGYWKTHRPASHGKFWLDVNIVVSPNETLGPIDFTPPRLYNFINPVFLEIAEQKMMDLANIVKPGITNKTLKKELSELSQIIGGRIKSKNEEPIKLFRGNTKKVKSTVADKLDLSANLKKPETKIQNPAQTWLSQLMV